MAMRLPTATRNAVTDAIVDLIDAGSGAGLLRIYSGSQPSSATSAPTGTLLAELTFSDPAFGASATGTASANAITQDASANADGTAGWARILDSDENTVFDGQVTVTGGGGQIELNTTTIVTGSPVTVTALNVTTPAG